MQDNLRALVQEVSSAHPNTQPADLARFVVKQTPDEQLVDFYEAALVPFVNQVLRLTRNTAIDNVVRRDPVPSAKLGGIRSHWATMLATAIYTADGWKQMGNCTVEDFNYAIATREARIVELQGKIADLTLLRDHMLAHGAHTLSEAPEMQ